MSPISKRQRHPPGADRELECRAIAGELGQYVDRRGDDSRVELRAGTLVVAGGYLLTEVVLLHDRDTCSTRQPRPASSITVANQHTAARLSPNAGSSTLTRCWSAP
jgi:hypothetical protein